MNDILEYLGGRTQTESVHNAIVFSVVEKFLKDNAKFPIELGKTKSWFSNISEDSLGTVLKSLPGEKLIVENDYENNVRYVLVKYQENQLLAFTFYVQQGIVRQLNVQVFGNTVLPEILTAYLETYKFTQTLQEENKIPIYYCFPSPQGRISLHTRNFETISFDSIKDNYVPVVQKQAAELFAALNNVTHGLVILHGPVGTGKTFLIKALLSEVTKGRNAVNSRNGIICSPPSEFLATPYLLTQAVMEIERPIVILEDAGEMFQEDSKSRFQDQFSNLANYTDGLMSLMSEAIFLLTFNYDIKHLDAALTRNGRCISNIEVPRLPMEQASKLAGHQLDKGDYSLADLYAMKDNTLSIAKPQNKTVGFQRNRDSAIVQTPTVARGI